MLGILVFAAQQPERGFRSRAGHYIRAVHADARKHHQAVAALRKNIGLGIYKIFRTQDTDIPHGGNLVGIMKTGVDDGNRHPLSFEARFVQFITIAQPYLPNRESINAVGV